MVYQLPARGFFTAQRSVGYFITMNPGYAWVFSGNFHMGIAMA
jgi:hypothetical protein